MKFKGRVCGSKKFWQPELTKKNLSYKKSDKGVDVKSGKKT